MARGAGLEVEVAEEVERALRAVGTPARALHEKRYLRSTLEHLGASVPAIRKVVRQLERQQPPFGWPQLLARVEALWARPVHEVRMAAVVLLERHAEQLLPDDLPRLERLVREGRTWALVDGLAAHAVGGLVERFPALGRTLDRWARDDDFWVRRAALLALLVPLREGRGDFERLGRYADAMLEEREFFIRKAIGWVLRETGRRRPALVHAWLEPRAARASGLTLREAVRHLPAAQKDALLAAHAAGARGGRAPRSAAGQGRR